MTRKPYELPITPLKLEQFHWDAATKTLSAEASELDGFGIRPLYNDACDTGIAIVNRHGKEVRFAYQHATCRDGEQLLWTFVPVVRNSTGVEKVVVFND